VHVNPDNMAPQPSPPTNTPSRPFFRLGPADEGAELLFRHAHTDIERVALASVILLTVAAARPARCASLEAVVDRICKDGAYDQFDARVAIATLDRRLVL